MKLTTRFLILTGISGLAVVLSLTMAYWGIATINHHVRDTYGEMTGILANLDLVKRNFEHQMQALEVETYRRVPGFSDRSRADKPSSTAADETSKADAPSNPADQPRSALIAFNLDRMRQLNLEIRRVAASLNNTPSFGGRYIGTNTSDAITTNIRELADHFDHCYVAIQENANETLGNHFLEIRLPFEKLHLFVESIEGRMLEDLEASLDFAEETGLLVNLVLLTCLALAALIVLLVFMLQGRWFNRPLQGIRAATNELRRGNLEHRVPVTSRDELGYLAEDINEMAATIIKIQEQLLERERMAAVGEMMRRIVHNLRNPLAGIRSLAELTRSELATDSDEFENQDRIVRTVDQFERWLEEVLHSTRSLEVRTEAVDARAFIHAALEPQRATAEAKAIDLQINLAEAPADVQLDTVHFQHALVALVANAIEACPQNGIVQVIGREMLGSRPPQDFSSTSNGTPSEEPRWELLIEDSGPGIDDEWRNRIFEPYFTTKRHGTGIGLAVVRNVVKAHDGEIAVHRSEFGARASK